MASGADWSEFFADTGIQQVAYFPELGSTNDLALEWIARGEVPPLPCLIWAESQTQGRGRGANVWWTAPGALTFSLLVDAQQIPLPQERWPQIALTTGLAVQRALTELLPGIDVRVKWPNDVYAAERKVCGILVEVPPQRSGLIVIGIGINVGNSFRSAPLELRTKAAALCDLVAEPPTLAETLHSVIVQLERLLPELAPGFAKFAANWPAQCLLSGRSIEHTAGENITRGVCRGVDDQGCLLLETTQGTQRLLGGVITRWSD